MPDQPEIVDAQLHPLLPDCPEYPHDQAYLARMPPSARSRFVDHSFTAEDLIAMMDSVGVDAAVLVSPGVYGDDHRLTLEAVARHPHRFAAVGPLFPATRDVQERVRTFRDQRGALGVRVIGVPGQDVTSPEFALIYAAAQEADVPVFLMFVDMLPAMATIARDHPSLQVIVDHMGLMTFDGRDMWSRIPDLVALAQHENVAVKCSAAPHLSHAPFPFGDLWPHLHSVIDAFGPERVMWGSDATVHLRSHSYDDGLAFLRDTGELSPSEKALILGASLRRILRWPA